jgi:hypothetical protein
MLGRRDSNPHLPRDRRTGLPLADAPTSRASVADRERERDRLRRERDQRASGGPIPLTIGLARPKLTFVLDSASLAVNLDDPDDIREKLPRIEDRVRAKHDELQAAEARLREAQAEHETAQRAAQHWATLLSGLRKMAPSDEPDQMPQSDPAVAERETPPVKAGSGSVMLVVQIINEAGREMLTREVREAAKDHGLADDTVSWALWRASTDGLIRRVKKGRYAPLEAQTEQSELPASPVEADQAEDTAGVHTR